MPRTLLICNTFPTPENSGFNIRTMNLARYFRNIGPVDIVYTHCNDGASESGYFAEEYSLAKQEYPRSMLKRGLMALKGHPYPVLCYTRDSEKFLRHIITSGRYDYILVRYVQNTGGLLKLPEKYRRSVIVDFDDILSGSLYETYFAPAGSGSARLLRKLNQQLLIRYEKRCLNFAACLFCSDLDRSRIGGKKENTFTVPNVYENADFKAYEFGSGFEKGNLLLFVGSLFYEPNIEGLRWFIEAIFPVFKRTYPDARLLVVGGSPKEEAKALCRRDAIELFADAADLKSYYRRCRAVIVPLLKGSGTRIKILEAASAGRAVLATPTGAEGLGFKDEDNILMFDCAQTFLAKYRTLSDENKYRTLTRQAAMKAKTEYGAERLEQSMAEVLRHVARALQPPCTEAAG